MFNIFKKKLIIPNGETKEVEVVQTWNVTWQSRYGEYSNNVSEQKEFFFSEEIANDFANQLREAFKLIKHTSGNYVTVQKTK